MIRLKLIWSVLALSVALVSCAQKTEFKVNSPNNKIELGFSAKEGTLNYQVSFKGSALIKKSKLGFEFKNMEPLIAGFKVIASNIETHNETWEQVWGENKVIENKYTQLSVYLEEKEGDHRLMNLYFKVYNDGVGFRYEIPEQGTISEIEITNELTAFNFTADHSAWYNPANFDSYEMEYQNTPISNVKSANTPITFVAKNGTTISIHEANLTNFAGMTLKKSEKNALSFESDLVPWPGGVKVKTSTPMLSPWRTIQIGEKATDLVASNMILNLNEPNQIEDTSWIEPMKYIGVWWGMHLGTHTWTMGDRHGATTKETKKFIDFAAKNNIGGVLVEGWNTGWEDWGKKDAFDFVTPYKDFDLKGITAYAAAKNIDFIGHVETGGAATSFEENFENIFGLYQKLGVRTVKTGYAGGIQTNGQFHHGQFMVNHYRKVVETAANYGIMINAHEPIKPTGIRRTFPNMMTREGTRGMEWNAWSKGNSPEHHTVLPFTRGLGGPIDYTPGTFDILYKNAKNRVKWNGLDDGSSRVNTTLAKQLALFVTLYSPLQMASDLVENYENQPAFKFFKDFGTDWETSEILNGEIGDYITIARKEKNSDTWFLGSVTDQNARSLEVSLSFLDKDATYVAEIYADGQDANWKTNPQAIDISTKNVTSKSTIKLRLAAGGGQAIRFIKK